MKFCRIIFLGAAVCGLGWLHAENEVDEKICQSDILLSYFPEPIVDEVLKKNQIPENLWASILADLAKQNALVEKIVAKKNAEMKRNPFWNMKKKNDTTDIYLETLHDLFSQTMQKFGVTNQDQVASMLDEIHYRKGKLIKHCMQQKQK